MKKNKIGSLLILVFFAFTMLVVPLKVLAQDEPADSASDSDNGIKRLQKSLRTLGSQTGLGNAEDMDLIDTVAAIINIFLSILGILAVVYILYGGFKWMTAAGNNQDVQAAKDIIKNAVIGLVIIFLSFAIANFVVGALSEGTGARDSGSQTEQQG